MPTEQPRPWCVFTSAGDKHAIDRWLKQGDGRRWDLVVAYYGDDDQEFSRLAKLSSYAFRSKGGKFQNLKTLVTQIPHFFDEYSHVWVCDDDILMSAAQIETAFSITQANGFWISQPALALRGKNSHRINRYAGQEFDWRIVNFVECGVPIFRRDKLLAFLAVYDGSLAGYGIDYWYINLLGANATGKFAVIDKVQVTNPTDAAKGGSEINRLQSLPARRADWDAVRKERGLVEFPHKVFAYGKLAALDGTVIRHDGDAPSMRERILFELRALRRSDWPDRGVRLRHIATRIHARAGVRLRKWFPVRPAGGTPPTSSPESHQTLAARLGYAPTARLLIVHADDVGQTHSVNAAFFSGSDAGVINSGSAMVASPWFPETMAHAHARPGIDLGVHLALTSERSAYRWGPVAPAEVVPSLVDRLGYLHQTWTTDMVIDPEEVELELRAQIEKAFASGLVPTHFDSHQNRLQFGGRDLFSVFLRLGREFGVPVFVAREWFEGSPYLGELLSPEDVVIDRSISIDIDVADTAWPAFYRRAIETLHPGITQFVIHPGTDDPELRAFSAGRVHWGAAWRQRDLDFFMSSEFRSLLARHDVQLVTWREIVSRLSRH